MKEQLREYFTFTRKERLGIIVLLIIVLGLFIVPYWIRRPPGTEDPEATRQFGPAIENFSRDTASGNRESSSTGSAISFRQRSPTKSYLASESRFPVKLHYFDPNAMEEEDWQRLGLSARQSRTLVHYTGKGGRFRTAGDLEKIYGLSAEDRKRLEPWVRIKSANQPANRSTNETSDETAKETDRRSLYESGPAWEERRATGPESVSGRRKHEGKTPGEIDINLADSGSWEQLPGIGQKLAARIIRFREKLGGFYCVGQVAETFGLADSVFEKIRPWLRAGSLPVRRLDLNTASVDSLSEHPYVRWKLARILTRYREQHGQFQTIDELDQLALVDSKTLSRLKPYLTVNGK